MLKEFKTFIMKGSVVDLAVAVIIGAAFGKIVTSLTNDILMPPIGMILGKIDFSGMYWALDGKHYENLTEAQKVKAPVIAYGQFLNNVVDFLIVAFVLFLIMRAMNRFKKAAEVTTKKCVFCKTNIDLAATRCPNCTSELEPAAVKP